MKGKHSDEQKALLKKLGHPCPDSAAEASSLIARLLDEEARGDSTKCVACEDVTPRRLTPGWGKLMGKGRYACQKHLQEAKRADVERAKEHERISREAYLATHKITTLPPVESSHAMLFVSSRSGFKKYNPKG